MTYWVTLDPMKGKRYPFQTINEARKEAIQMIFRADQLGQNVRQATIFKSKTGNETYRGDTTYVGDVVNYSGDFRWIHYYYKEGITLSLSDVIDYNGKIVKKDPKTQEWKRYGIPKSVKSDYYKEPLAPKRTRKSSTNPAGIPTKGLKF